MRNKKVGTIGIAIIAVALLSLAVGFAFAGNGQPLTPELAAKREMVHNQQQQRVTYAQRKIAADALKAERVRVYQAKEYVKRSTPQNLLTN